MTATTKLMTPTRNEHLRERAARVVPGGMYGHVDVRLLPDGYPQFFARAQGARIWDVDGKEYVDLMCSSGPIVLGHHHPAVDAAAAAQARLGDCMDGPAEVFVELAERLVRIVRHADWAMFMKNGTDAITVAVMLARAKTGRRKVLLAERSYHGVLPWCSPFPGGRTDEDQAHLVRYRFNDLDDVRARLADHDGDVAAVLVSPYAHDDYPELPPVDPAFARGLRALCDETGAALVLDDVRGGFRLAFGGSWEPIDVSPDLSAWSKAIANGHALSAVLGSDAFRESADRIFTTGSFWFSSVAMAAALATLDVIEKHDALGTMVAAGARLREGLETQAAGHGLGVRMTGPVQMPFVAFESAHHAEMLRCFVSAALDQGLLIRHDHHWFTSAAHRDVDIDRALEATDVAFAAVRSAFGGS